MNKMNKKGFTLIEMLVVIAIIAVLVSIIIPVVSSSTDKAEAASNAANLRSLKAEIVTEMLTMPKPKSTDAVTSPSGRWSFTAASDGGTGFEWSSVAVAQKDGTAVFELPFDGAFACTITDGNVVVTLDGDDIAAWADAAEGNS